MTGLLIVVGAASFLAGCWLIAAENVKQRREQRRRIVLIRLAWECGK